MAPSPEHVATNPVLANQLDAAVSLCPSLFRVFSPDRQILEEAPVRLQPGVNRIGREAGIPPRIVLSGDRGVSREHAHVEYDPATNLCTLHDTSSLQSSWLNGVRLKRGEKQRLQPQDVIRLGDSILVYVAASAPYFSLFADDSGVPAEARTAKLMGRAAAILDLRRKLATVARAAEPFPLLLLGESGTGKERAAEEFHIASGRRSFVPINCAMLEAATAESTLFGHVRGAFTNALQNRAGLFGAAHQGTLFLDEVAELPADVQSKLLRVLAEHQVHRMGEEEQAGKRVDVLVVAATSRPLVEDVRSGAFRFDLFRRLRGISLRVPSLRSRREDILYLLQRAPAMRKDKSTPALIPALPVLNASQVELLLLHHWPGNVAELLSVRSHLTNLGFDADLIERLREPPPTANASALAPPSSPPAPWPVAGASFAAPGSARFDPAALDPTRADVPARSSTHNEPRPSAARIHELLLKHRGNLVQMEKETGWSRRTLRELVYDCGLTDLMNKLRDPG